MHFKFKASELRTEFLKLFLHKYDIGRTQNLNKKRGQRARFRTMSGGVRKRNLPI